MEYGSVSVTHSLGTKNLSGIATYILGGKETQYEFISMPRGIREARLENGCEAVCMLHRCGVSSDNAGGALGAEVCLERSSTPYYELLPRRFKSLYSALGNDFVLAPRHRHRGDIPAFRLESGFTKTRQISNMAALKAGPTSAFFGSGWLMWPFISRNGVDSGMYTKTSKSLHVLPLNL